MPAFKVGLFRKPLDVVRGNACAVELGCGCAFLDIAIAGFRPGGRRAENDDVGSGGGDLHASLDDLAKALLVGDDVVGREDAEDGIGCGALHDHSGERAGRGGIAGAGFAQNALVRDLRKLLRDGLGEQLVGDDEEALGGGDGTEALDRLLDHGFRAGERENLLGAGTARARPEARAAASGEDYGNQCFVLRGFVGHALRLL